MAVIFVGQQQLIDSFPEVRYLPGDPKFHVEWTGVAEMLGGAVTPNP